MGIIYNKSEEGECIECGKPLKDADQTGGWATSKGNLYGMKLYCSYRCINDAGTRKAKQRRKEAMSNLTCLNCKKVFDAKRHDTKFCCCKCRVIFFRAKKKQEIIDEENNKIENERLWNENQERLKRAG